MEKNRDGNEIEDTTERGTYNRMDENREDFTHVDHEHGTENDLLIKEKSKSENKSINIIRYNEKEYHEKKVTLNELKENSNLLENIDGLKLWINVDDDFNDEAVEVISNIFNIHPLVKEDIILRKQRPKVDDYAEYSFTVAKMIYFKEEELILEQVSFILGKNHVITFGEVEGDVFDDLRKRLKSRGSLVRKSGSDYLFYSLMDAIVDGYFDALEIVGDRLDVLEEKVMTVSSDEERKEIRRLKKELLYIHKFSWPLRETMSWISKGDSDLIGENTLIYFRDIYNQLVQVIDTTETYRELLSGLVELNLSNVSYRLNEVMKVLTIISTIFIPLTFLAGIYGMNFKYMPELNQKWSYPVLWVIMLIIAGAMLYYFKKKKWF
ncbi:MAG: magnesium/cobalt transporter CorA [Clostridiaceae bacterium]